MLKTPFPFPLPEIRLGQGLMECHALSSGFGFAYEIFRFLLHSPEAIQARTEENPKNVFAPDRKQPPLSTFPTPENALIPIWLPEKYLEVAVVPVDLFPIQEKQYSRNKKPGAASRRAGPAK